MSMDLHVLQSRLDRIHRARPFRGAAYVASYVGAWYFDDSDLDAWIMQNKENYCAHHLDALRRGNRHFVTAPVPKHKRHES